MTFDVVDSNGKQFGEREVKTTHDLEKLLEEHPGWHDDKRQKEFIVCFGCIYHNVPTIILYDDYIE